MPLLMASVGFGDVGPLFASPICFMAVDHIANPNARSAQSRVNAASRQEEVQFEQIL